MRELELMENKVPLVDHTFALKQFSGNSALLLKMLGKFVEQYQSIDELLRAQLAEQDFTSLKLQVHTIKGVSGNLGMTALHLASREYEGHIESSTDTQNLQHYLSVLQQTLSEVKRLITEGGSTASSFPSNSENKSKDLKQSLLDSLNRNEFITQSKLTAYLSELPLSEEQALKLKTAIADFDYQTAIRIIG